MLTLFGHVSFALPRSIPVDFMAVASFMFSHSARAISECAQCDGWKQSGAKKDRSGWE